MSLTNVHVASSGSGGVPPIEVLDPEDVLGISAGEDILVADDDHGNLAAYEAALAPLGRRLVLVQSGAEALARLLDEDFALLLLDVSMPQMGGLETARRIRELPRNRGLPIIFITGVAWSTEVMLEAYAVGALDFLTKPILPEVLRAKARLYLQLQERSRTLLRESAQLRDAHSRLVDAHAQLRARAIAAVEAGHATRRKDDFLAALGHELRNPLAAAVNALGVLKARGPETSREIAILERQVGRLTHIVGDLLDFSRIAQGSIQLHRAPIAIDVAIAAALEDARAAIDQRGHQITVDAPDGLAVDADRRRLKQVLGNLLDNAVKYTPESGRIAISAERDGAFVRVTVRDNGRGIAPELLPTVFEPFVQGQQGLDRSDGGLGIGLTLVSVLVELHGGTVEARSDGADRGATFTLRWPAVALPAPAPPAVRAGSAPRRILIVDDNADAADMLAELLRVTGHDVAVARDAEGGLAIAEGFAPHVALLDIGLPTIDGYELAGRLRLIPACRTTVLVAVTGYGQPGDRQRSRAAGFAHHLVKPANLATLESLLATVPGDAPATADDPAPGGATS